jgi:hypothetical protein
MRPVAACRRPIGQLAARARSPVPPSPGARGEPRPSSIPWPHARALPVSMDELGAGMSPDSALPDGAIVDLWGG